MYVLDRKNTTCAREVMKACEEKQQEPLTNGNHV